MAVCQFDGIAFDIESPDDQFWPLMSLGADGPPVITLTILIYSRADMTALYNRRSRVTARVAVGTFTGRVVVHAGPGAKPLRIPTGANNTTSLYSAVLTDLSVSRHGIRSDLYRADATWMILSDTP